MKIKNTILTIGGIILASLLTMLGINLLASSASAHNAALSAGTATCLADGTYRITWTISNDYPDEAHLTVLSADPGDLLLSSTTIPARPSGAPYPTVTGVQVVPGTSTSASISVKSSWPKDNFTQTKNATVALAGTCAIDEQPTPTEPTTTTPAPVTTTPSPIVTTSGGVTVPTTTTPSGGVNVPTTTAGVGTPAATDPITSVATQPAAVASSMAGNMAGDMDNAAGSSALPVTGPEQALPLGIGVALVLAGTGLMFVARRRVSAESGSQN